MVENFKPVTVGNVTFGQGRPKIIVPLVGKTAEEILTGARQAKDLDCDLIEWRIDFYEKVTTPSEVAALSKEVCSAVEKPVLVTFRTAKEGGVLEISDQLYFDIYAAVLNEGHADLIDLELFMSDKEVQETIALAHEKGTKIIMCNHDFDATPSQDEIERRLRLMEEKNADICKIAVMPQSNTDVLTLLQATATVYATATRPLITMSMGALGMVSRVSGEVFGSSATFGAAAKASAPGQVPVAELRNILSTLKLTNED
ncbi:3-dehydroquinate dehydratase-1 [Streptococcus gallinaceus]|uniref:type I 3-dehydroquinate dehydratase n=1 Tax=Streptococcus gallinaceus TaxID=165758 RepID=UPI0020A1A155|nr:type I 3-dehydroquinate dehydratase [Streptococcus gallinaceus]MCP1639138.1 3-dehydroquinate dehydratase-1 [Streptococcus gallinaceus]MCP1769618.1 3-dehydroquinate dehydratase-1 [Streptococcus gallinaceus]